MEKKNFALPDIGNLPVSSSCASSISGPRVDWSDAPEVPLFYGREEELAQLSQWIVQEGCRVVSVLGMGGIGKSALSISVMHRLAAGTGQAQESGASPDPTFPTACPFDVVIFRSLRDAPSCEVLLDECLQMFSLQSVGDQSAQQAQSAASMEQRISRLLSYLRKTRALLVLDNMESLLEAGDPRALLRPGFESYGQLLRRVAETSHQSCLLFTSREKPAGLRMLEGTYSQVRTLRLTGLDVAACKLLLEEKGVAPGFTV